jgi:Ca2+-binding RTX toxin-like protein
MAGVFDVQGFGVLSNYNGQFLSSAAQSAMREIADTNSNSIELAPRLFTQSRTSNDVLADPGKTESLANVATAIANAHALGLSVLLKPMLSSLDGAGPGQLTPTDPDAFFASYTQQIVAYARVAEQAGAESFSIGNELSGFTGAQYRDEWTNLIDQVRSVYHGEITYSAATDEVRNVSFWDQVDVIGINAYPPLTSELDPSVDEMIAAWNNMPKDNYWAAALNYQSPVDFFHSLATQYDKQVLFTEVGYRSLNGTNISPGGWRTDGTTDAQEQADAFKALFQVMSSEGGTWFKGMEIWNWDADNLYSPTGYSPMGKPAEQLITDWFGGREQPPALTEGGSPVADLIDVGGGNDILTGGLGDDVIRGGAGGDSIVGGPDKIAPLTETVVTVTGYGSVIGGVGAQMQLRINGQQIGSTAEFHTAADPSDYQTYTFSFPNPDQVNSLDVAFINDLATAEGDRNLYIKGITVNGHELTVADATNLSSPGTWNLYGNRAIHYDMAGRQDLFSGAATDNDTLDGGAGNDTVSGGAGDDLIDGGAGDDRLIGGAGGGTVNGGGGNDIIKTGLGDTGTTLNGDAGRDQLYGGSAVNVLNGGDGTDYLSSGGGADIMHGGAGDDSLKAGGSSAQLFGDDGNDTLQGGMGSEFLYGGAGNDKLIGNGGDDFLSGGADNDTFVFSPNFGKDIVTDFQNTGDTNDIIQFDRTLFADFSAVQSHATQEGTSVVITADANNTIELQNTTVENITADDFRFI